MPLRASEHEEALDLDVTYHGEEAYVTGEGAILVYARRRQRDRSTGRRPGLALTNCIKFSPCQVENLMQFGAGRAEP
jgi:hypothetical protein